jgi:hypothetical protein
MSKWFMTACTLTAQETILWNSDSPAAATFRRTLRRYCAEHGRRTIYAHGEILLDTVEPLDREFPREAR